MIKPKSILPQKEKIIPSRGGDTFYSSSRWRKVRAVKIKMNPICEECAANGVTTLTEEVDHVKPRKPTNYTGPAPAAGWGDDLALDNLRSLCKRHHASKSRNERHLYEGGRG